MPITRADFDSVIEEDVAELVSAGGTESIALDFKETTYGSSDADKRELLKDVSAFANTHGGHIVIGVSEVGGVASQVVGIQVGDIDTEVLRLDQIVRSGIEPRIPGFRVRAVPLTAGGHAIVIRIGRSWRVPHRVSAQGSFRFWIRNSGGCHEASMDELRTLFGQGTAIQDRARNFREERIALIQQGIGPRPLVASGRLIVHLIPHSALASGTVVDVADLYARHQAFAPIGSMSMTPRYNFDGVINERGGELNHGYTQLFRSGAIEATKANLLREHEGRRNIAGLQFEEHFFQRFTTYLNGLMTLGLDPPITVMISLQGIAGAYYRVFNNVFEDELTPFDHDVLRLPDCVVSEYGPPVAYHVAIRPAFDALWNAVGYSKAQFFDESGLWVGPKRR